MLNLLPILRVVGFGRTRRNLLAEIKNGGKLAAILFFDFPELIFC